MGDTSEDQAQASLYGQINQQVEKACRDLKMGPELQNGFNAIGFSQGGLFLRAYVENC